MPINKIKHTALASNIFDNIADDQIVLNSGLTGAPTGHVGIKVNRGHSNDVEIRYNETLDYWEVTNDGTTYNRIATTGGASGIGNVSEDATPQLGGDLESNSHDIQMADNDKIAFGTGEKGKIDHNGSLLQIFETIGGIDIKTFADNSSIVISSDDSLGGIAPYFKADGSTGESILYWYGTERLKASNNGIIVTGTLNTHTIPAGTGTLALTSQVASDTDGLAEGSTNKYYSDAQVATYLAGGSVANVIIGGNLTVNGTQTTVNSNNVNIGDNILTLNSDELGTPSLNAGIEIERGTSTNVSFRWNETTDKWEFTNDGTSYTELGESDLVGDTTPQLGGTLDANGNNIDLDGNELILDADGDTKIYANVDDELNLYAQSGKILFNYASNGLRVYEFTNSGATFSTGAGGIWPDFYFKRNYSSNTPAAGDKLAQIHARGEDSNGLAKTYVSMEFKAESVTQTSDRGSMTLSLHRNNQLVPFYKADASTGVEQNIFYKDIKADEDVKLIFEGATANTNDTTLTVTDPTGNNTITLPDATGTVALTSDTPSLSGYLQNVLEDTSPQLGANLDAQSFNITTTGKILFANAYTNTGAFPSASTYNGMFAVDNGSGNPYFSHNAGWKRIAQASETYTNSDVDTHLNQSNPTSGYVLSWNGSDYAWVEQSGGDVVDDTSPQLGGQLDVTGNSITNSVSVTSGSGTDYELRVEKATSDYVSLRLKNTQNFPGGGGSPYQNWPTRMVFEGKNQGQVSREIGIIYASHANGTNTSAEKGSFQFAVFNGYSGAFANACEMVPCNSSNSGGIKTQGLLVGSSNSTTFPTAGNITIQSGGNITFGDGTTQTTAGVNNASAYALIQIFG